MAVVALVVYAAALAAGAVAVWRSPARALYAFVLGLAVHNAVMAGLFALGVRGRELTVIAAWKEALLAVALASLAVAAYRRRALPFRPVLADVFALLFAAFVVLYAVLPQSWLDGEADGTAVLYGLRHGLVVVAAYALGRSIVLPPVRRLVLVTAAAVGLAGVVEAYTVPIDWWEDADVPKYFAQQLGFEHHGPRALPENFVFNTGEEDELLRRSVSTFLSPLGTAYMLVVALCLWAARPRWWPLALVAAVGLLFTFTRAALIVLAGALVVLAYVQRRWWPAAAAAATLVVAAAWTQVFPSIAPETTWSQADLRWQRAEARRRGITPGETVALDEPSIRSHLTALRDGAERVVEHPQGYGLGNAGATALRNDVPLKAGESTYTELGVETGLLGALAFIAWNAALLWGLVRAGAAGAAAALAAVLALGIQTDVLGTPWIAYVLWILAGGSLAAALRREGGVRRERLA